MDEIRVVPLGAGQDVGRSCILLSLRGKNIMLDCGMHMGYNDERRFPDFSYISASGRFTQTIDAVCVTHFHLDHCGAIVHFAEVCGYDGPIYMTHPTKAIAPILLEDYRKITVERKGETNFFTSDDIKECMKKVIPVNIHQTVKVDDRLSVQAYYAGHVLGAAMFKITVDGVSVVYTGDYNMTPDRHLGAAWIDRCRPDLLITETTYGTYVRDSKRQRERDFLKKVHRCVERGGKVLIPVFALGRAQELCILIDTYWQRMNLKHVPIFFSAGLTTKANYYYKLFIRWTNQKIRDTFVDRNMFDFVYIREFERHYADLPGPMVVFATPGMLHAGTSLAVFKKWCSDSKNLVILPGYCVEGTVGNKLLAGFRKDIEVERGTVMDCNMQVDKISFSAHADSKGIMQLLRMAEPRNVLLVHGEPRAMNPLKQRIIDELGIPCYNPKNGVTIAIEAHPPVDVAVPAGLIGSQRKRTAGEAFDDLAAAAEPGAAFPPAKIQKTSEIVRIRGVVCADNDDNGKLRLMESAESLRELGLPRHNLNFSSSVAVNPPERADEAAFLAAVVDDLNAALMGVIDSDEEVVAEGEVDAAIHTVRLHLDRGGPAADVGTSDPAPARIVVSWGLEDNTLAEDVINALRKTMTATASE